MRWFRKNVRWFSRRVAAGMVMIWTVTALSPCVIASTYCPPQDFDAHYTAGPGDRDNTHPDQERCNEFTSFVCNIADENIPTASPVSVDFTPVPVLLLPSPIIAELGVETTVKRLLLSAQSIPQPPLNLQHGVFLN
jgi:hypothetical protein